MSEGAGVRAVVRALSPDDWRLWRELRQAALSEAPQAFASTLADWSGANDTEDRWRARLAAVPFNAIALIDESPVGMVSSTAPAERSCELLSLWVSPQSRGTGVGDLLVSAVLHWALAQGADHLTLEVRRLNTAAIRLYERNGFREDGPATSGRCGAEELSMRLSLPRPGGDLP